MANEIRLDKKMFEVLSSDTRRKILLDLYTHPRTVTDLSKFLGVQKSAVYEHLQILMEVGLVYKKESNNKFVYYDLTENGKAIINQNSSPDYKIYITLTASILSLGGGFLEMLIALTGISGGPALTNTPIPAVMPNPEGTAMPAPTVMQAPGGLTNVHTGLIGPIIGICLVIAGIILLYHSLRSLRANKGRVFSFPFIPG